jgi:hypothetical protein
MITASTIAMERCHDYGTTARAHVGRQCRGAAQHIYKPWHMQNTVGASDAMHDMFEPRVMLGRGSSLKHKIRIPTMSACVRKMGTHEPMQSEHHGGGHAVPRPAEGGGRLAELLSLRRSARTCSCAGLSCVLG